MMFIMVDAGNNVPDHCRRTKFLSSKTRGLNIVERFCFTVAPGDPMGPAAPGFPSFPFTKDRTNNHCSCGDNFI